MTKVNAIERTPRLLAVKHNRGLVAPQATQTLFEIYMRDSIALRFEPFKRMYETVRKSL